MKYFSLLTFFFLSLLVDADLVVHEWGSINFVTGQKKISVGDIADDQSDLPPFVEVWTRQPQLRPMMIEKPILYFYTQERMNVTVSAQYPEGIFTQWWPKPVEFRPRFPEGRTPPPTKGGNIAWRITLDPAEAADAQLPAMKDHPWWPIARDVDAATVLSERGGAEKFLFYRGAGAFTPTLEVDISEKGDFLLRSVEEATVRDVYTVRVRDGEDPQFTYYSDLSSDAIRFEKSDEVAKHMQGRLEAKGLFAKEAAGMVTIWRKAMFEEPGYRAMYIMEREDVDKLLPLMINPIPKSMERVFLIRFDCLSPEMKSKMEAWIIQLGADGYRERRAAKENLMEAGRLGEALMRSTYEETWDPEVKKSLKDILKAITPKNPHQ